MTPASGTRAEPSPHYVDFDDYIGIQLHRAQSNIKLTDLMTAAGWGVSFLLAFTLLFVLFDHWVVPGGFGVAERIAAFSVLVGAGGGWLLARVAWPWLKTIHPLYAARQIEKVDPDFKSSLINVVDLQTHDLPVPEAIRFAMEKRAAVELSRTNLQEVADHKALLRSGYVLLAVAVVVCAYALFSPKDALSSVRRLLLPTAGTIVATRTTIDDVTPGDVRLLARTMLTVECRVSGEIPEQVTLYYTTDDRRYVDQPVVMRPTGDGESRFRATVTGEDGRGLLQGLQYHLVAGDARSPTYTVTVAEPPSARVYEVELTFPAYTGIEARTQESGHIDALEGTRVALKAQTNLPVASAFLVLTDTEDAPNGESIPMTIAEGRQLAASWTLAFRKDGTQPRFYHIECRTESGERDPQPTQYGIRIRPDERPLVEILHPQGDLERPADAVIPLVVRASDPDFKLRFLTLKAEYQGTEVYAETFLAAEQARFTGPVDFPLAKCNVPFKAGDLVEFWVEARDNKLPLANRTNSPRRRVTIREPLPHQERDQQQQQDRRDQQDQLQQADPEQNPQRPDDAQPPREGQPQGQPDPRQGGAGRGKPQPNAPAGMGQPQAGDPPPEERGENKPMPAEGTDPEASPKPAEGMSGAKPPMPRPSPTTGQPPMGQADTEEQPAEGNSGTETNPPMGAGQSGSAPTPGSNPPPKPKADDLEALRTLLNRQKNQPAEEKPEEQPPAEETPESPEPGTGKPEPGMGKPEPGTGKPEPGMGKPEPGMGKPEPGMGKPEPGMGKPEPGMGKPEPGTGKPEPGTGKPEPGMGKPEPGMGKPEPGMGKPEPGMGKPEPGMGKPEPGMGKPEPGMGKSEPGMGKPEPGENEAQPGVGPRERPEQVGTEGEPDREEGADTKNPRERRPGAGPNEDPPPQGAGRPNQKSQRPDTGEGGGSAPTSRGNPGSDEPGPGDTEEKPGGMSKTREPGSKTRPGAGRTHPDGTGKTAASKTNSSETEDPKSSGTKPSSNRTGTEGAAGGPAMTENPPGAEDAGAENPRAGTLDGGKPSGEKPMTGARSERPQASGEKPANDADPDGARSRGQPQPDGQPTGRPPQGQDPDGPAQDGGGSPNEGSPSGKTPGKAAGSQTGRQSSPGSARGPNQQPRSSVGGGITGPGSDTGNAAAGDPAGEPGEGVEPPAPVDPENDAEAANLEYSRKATNLVLKRLKGELERGEVDEDLLKELGWTKEEMARFVKRLESALQDDGQDQSPEAAARRRQFEATLESLKLRPDARRRKGETHRETHVERAGSRRSSVPPQYRELIEAYTRELSNTGPEK